MKRPLLAAFLSVFLTLGAPGLTHAQEPTAQEAFEQGCYAGASIPLLVKGGLFFLTGVGITAIALSDGGWGTLLLFASIPVLIVGTGELIAGGALAGIGFADVPAEDTRAHAAYDAGYDVGTGGALIGIGAAFMVPGLFYGVFVLYEYLTSTDDIYYGDEWLIPAIMFAIGAGFLGGGIALHLDGHEQFEALGEGGSGGGELRLMVPIGTWSF